MKEYLYFTYNGIHSKDMGIFNANTETGMFEEPFLSRRTINETEIRGRSKPYFHGVQRAPLQFTLKLVFEEKYDDEKISEVARWLDQDDYKEFYFDDNPEQRFFCIPVEDITHIHNGLKEGYLELTMRCNDAYSYSPEYISRIYDFTDNPLKYSESSYEEFQNGKELNGLVISEEGSIQLEKEGIDFNKIIQSDTDWQSEGVFDKTKIKNSKLELEYKIEPGINYNKTEDTQSDWEYDGSDQPEYVYASPLRQDSDGDGVVDGWSRTPDLPDVTESFSVDSAEEAQKISVTNTSTAGPHYINIFKIIPVKTTSTYSFSGDLRVANAVGNFIARLTITWLDASQNVISHSLGAGYGNTDYVRAKLENLTPPENAAYAMIKCEVRVSSVGDSGNAWFKNIYFNKGAVALDYPGSIIKHLDTTISPGDLTLAKEGSDLEKIVQKDIEWVEGDHFNTTHNDDQLMLDFEIPPGEDYAKTDETQQDWEDPDAVLENLDTITSPGNLQLQKEGTDYVDDESSTSDWDTGSHVNTRSIDNHLELDWDMPPGKDVILANSDDDDWNNAESMVGVVSKNNTLQLAKEGSDFNALYTSNADFQGTHDGTIAINNKIQLIDQGSDYDRYIKSRSDFDLGTYNKTVYSGSSNGYVKLNNLPSWEMESDLSDFLKDFYTPDEHVYQRNGYVDIYVTHKHPYNDDNGIKVRDRIVSYPLTCDFLAKISGDTHIYMSDMPPGKRVGNYIKIYGLPRSSSWAWYRVILRKNGCEIYRNGKRVYPDKVKTGTTTTWTNRLTLMVDNGHIGRMQITHFYMRSGVDLGPPPTNNLYTGTWTSQEFDISGAGVVKQTSFNYSWAKNGKNTEYQNVIMEVRVKKNGVWGSWQTVNGNTIPGISNGENLSNTNARMQIRATLQSYDPGYTPHLKDISFSIRSTSYTSGSYTSKVIDISHVVKVSSTNIRWSWNSNGAGSITSWVRIGDDDGFGTITWGSWQQATNGGTIPGIDSSTDLTNKRLQFKFDLSTSDSTVTPELFDVSLSLVSAYRISGSRYSYPIDVRNVNEVVSSSIDWDSFGDVKVYVRIEDSSGWQPWIEASNNSEIPYFSSGADVRSYLNLQYRVDMTTTDISKTPTLSYLNIDIQATQGRRFTTGYRESVAINISQVGKAGATLFTWEDKIPSGTSVQAEVDVSLDGGSSWLGYQSINNGDPIPQIDQSTDLSNALFRYRFSLTTQPGSNITPEIIRVDYQFYSGFKTTGQRTSPVLDISQVNELEQSILYWSDIIPEGTSVVVETRYSTDGGTTWSTWSTIQKNDSIPGLAPATDLRNGRLQYRLTLSTNDTTQSPVIESFSISIEATPGEYFTSGYREEVVDISSVVKAASAVLYWGTTLAENTSVDAQIALSLDGGNSWGIYQTVVNGEQIPQIDQTTDLSNARLKIRFNLSTSDPFVSPAVTDYALVLISGYKPEGSRISPIFNIEDTKMSVSSAFDWVADVPTNTILLVEKRIGEADENQVINWEPWEIINQGDPVIPDGTITTNKRLQYRITMFSNDTSLSPTVSNVNISIVATDGERYNTGQYVTNPIDISSVVKAGKTEVLWNEDIPENTSVIIESRLALETKAYADGNYTWTPWQTINADGSIPGVDQVTNLSEALLQLRITLTTTDVSVTPKVSDLNLSLTTGYKAYGRRQSKEISLLTVNMAYGSKITWDAEEPEGTEVIIETSINGGETWEKAINGGSVPSIRDQSDIREKTLLIRQTLLTSNTLFTPKLNSLEVVIDEGITIYNKGDVDMSPEMWIQKYGDGDIKLIHRHTGEVFEFAGLKDQEEIYVDNENEDIVTNIPGIYRYDNFNDNYLRLPRGRNDFQVVGNFKLQLRYRYKILQR